MEKDKRLNFIWSLSVISRLGPFISLACMGKKTQVGSIPESLGDICNTGGKELRLFRRGGSAFRAGTKKKVW